MYYWLITHTVLPLWRRTRWGKARAYNREYASLVSNGVQPAKAAAIASELAERGLVR